MNGVLVASFGKMLLIMSAIFAAQPNASWRLLLAQYPEEPALNVSLDEAIGEAVGRGAAPPTVRLWENGETLVLGRFELRDLDLADGHLHRWAQTNNLALLRRVSGGQAVWQGPGALNYSVCVPRREPYGIHWAYETLSAGVVQALRRWGLSCSFGRVAGAYCDGSHNLVVQQRKLAGTAQARRKGFILVHGTVLIDADLERIVGLISEFYRLAGQARPIRRAALTTLSEALGRTVTSDQVKSLFTAGYAEVLGISSYWSPAEAPSPDELRRARELAHRYSLSSPSPVQ